MTSQRLLQELETICKQLKYGCRNRACRIGPNTGQCTNDHCRCRPIEFSKRLLTLSAELEKQGREWEKSCTHEPSSPIAAFCFTCKHCGEEIESVKCEQCDGGGVILVDVDEFNGGHSSCPDCNGTGVDHWEVVK